MSLSSIGRMGRGLNELVILIYGALPFAAMIFRNVAANALAGRR